MPEVRQDIALNKGERSVIRRLLLLSILAAFSLPALQAQTQINPITQVDWTKLTGGGVPTLTCTADQYGQQYTDITASPNAQYVCGVGGWLNLISASSGSGTLSGQVPGFAVCASSATAATGPCALDFSVTTAATATLHEGFAVDDGSGKNGSAALRPGTGTATPTSGYAIISNDGSGNGTLSNNGGAFSPIATTAYVASPGAIAPSSVNGIYELSQSGLKCDGITDDTSALNALLSSLSGKGGKITGAGGRTCLILGQVLTPSEPTAIVIEGGGATGSTVDPVNGFSLDMRYAVMGASITAQTTGSGYSGTWACAVNGGTYTVRATCNAMVNSGGLVFALTNQGNYTVVPTSITFSGGTYTPGTAATATVALIGLPKILALAFQASLDVTGVNFIDKGSDCNPFIMATGTQFRIHGNHL